MNKIGSGKNKNRIRYKYFRIWYEWFGSGMNKIGSGKKKSRIQYKYFGSSVNKSLGQSMATNKFGSGMNKIGSLWIKISQFFQFSEIWGQREDTYCSRGIMQVPSEEQSLRQSASEGLRDGPCWTETLAMQRVRFGLFHNISLKTIFFNSWRFLLKSLQNLTSSIHQHFHWFLGIFSTHYRYIWLQRGIWFRRQHL